MKPFNLQKALAGEPVITREGKQVTEIHHFKTRNDKFNVIAIIDGYYRTFDESGNYSLTDNSNDLFMKSQIVEYWVNVYKREEKLRVGASHLSQEDAIDNISHAFGTYIKTIKLTNEI